MTTPDIDKTVPNVDALVVTKLTAAACRKLDKALTGLRSAPKLEAAARRWAEMPAGLRKAAMDIIHEEAVERSSWAKTDPWPKSAGARFSRGKARALRAAIALLRAAQGRRKDQP